MSNETTGAIDHEFASNEAEARDQIESKLSEYNRSIQSGDVAIDLVYHRPVFVRRSTHESCVAYWEDGEDFDLTTYKAHPYLPVSADDTVFECVYLPTKPGDIAHEPGTKTYDFPSGRLARVPVENLWDSNTRWFDNRLAAFVASTLTNVNKRGVDTESVYDAIQSTVGDAVARDGLERAGLDFTEDDSE